MHRGSAAGVLTASRAFTTLSLIEIITTPLSLLLQTLPSITASLACLDRIQTYLKSPDRIDQRAKEDFDNDSESMEKERIIDSVQSDWPVISIREASITYESSADSPVLDSISLTVPHGSITMVVGPVGSGKSSLLKAILGELNLQLGDIYVRPGRIAYCDQTPWIPNGTVRDCIIGTHDGEFDGSWYDEVVHTCALEEDIVSLTNGSDTNVGSRGIALSDGQKHRLVRAAISSLTLFPRFGWLTVSEGTCKGSLLSVTSVDIGRRPEVP